MAEGSGDATDVSETSETVDLQIIEERRHFYALNNTQKEKRCVIIPEICFRSHDPYHSEEDMFENHPNRTFHTFLFERLGGGQLKLRHVCEASLEDT